MTDKVVPEAISREAWREIEALAAERVEQLRRGEEPPVEPEEPKELTPGAVAWRELKAEARRTAPWKNLSPCPVERPDGKGHRYSTMLVEWVVQAISIGASYEDIRKAGGPSGSTVEGWIMQYPEFLQQYQAALASQADFMDSLILDEAYSVQPEEATAARVKIDTYKWRAAHLNPRRFSDRHRLELSGPGGGPVQVTTINPRRLSPEQREVLRQVLDLADEAEALALAAPVEGQYAVVDDDT